MVSTSKRKKKKRQNRIYQQGKKKNIYTGPIEGGIHHVKIYTNITNVKKKKMNMYMLTQKVLNMSIEIIIQLLVNNEVFNKIHNSKM